MEIVEVYAFLLEVHASLCSRV